MPLSVVIKPVSFYFSAAASIAAWRNRLLFSKDHILQWSVCHTGGFCVPCVTTALVLQTLRMLMLVLPPEEAA